MAILGVISPALAAGLEGGCGACAEDCCVSSTNGWRPGGDFLLVAAGVLKRPEGTKAVVSYKAKDSIDSAPLWEE
jgi:hypothetical protein